MELEKLIAELNGKAIKREFSGNLEYPDLSKTQKELLKKYRPERAFIVYGTLGPGGPNHYFVENISGEWYKGFVNGSLESGGWGADLGYNGFRHTDAGNQQQIKAAVLVSDHMSENWERLDEFEGDGYIRVLAKFELEDGKLGVGYIYALK
ncbi:MAG: gamma-glutamylcyclotransferase [Pedobacter sp.]|uniref:gamma-glutamylcyclotransferase family protein n=1 Tax=Pedobacter sp. TaxID=1411316 RepID=UPI003566FCC4